MSDDDPVPGLVGRRSQCARLDQLLVDVRAHRSRVLVLRGEAGVGKTALMEHLAIASTDCRVVRAAGEAASGIHGANRLGVDAAVGSVWNTALEGDVPSVEQRANFQLAAHQAMRAGLHAVDMAFTSAGAGAIHAGHPLQRCFRDLHAAAQHAYFSPAALTRWAKVRLGIDQPLFML